jgi:hypothetical protein
MATGSPSAGPPSTKATPGPQFLDIDVLSQRARRGRLHSIWNDKILFRSQGSHPGLLAIVAILVLVLGTIGFHRTDAHLSVLDNIYDAMSLFVINTTLPNNPNLALNLARFLAPILVFYAALGVVFALYRDTFKRARIRRLRNHVVVAGLGVGGFRIARAFSDQNFPVVVIESNLSNPALEACHQRGIFTIVGNAADTRVLRQAGITNAAILITMCGDDGANIDVASAARVLSEQRRLGVLTALVEFDDFRLWHVMKAQALVDRDESAFRLELVNVLAQAAEVLLDQYPPVSSAEPSPHVLVVTTGGLGPNLVIGAVKQWLASVNEMRQDLRVTVAGPDPDAVIGELMTRNPELAEIDRLEIGTWKIEMAAAGRISDLPDGITAAYVALGSDTEALAAALTLRQLRDLARETPVVIAVADENAGVARTVARGGPGLDGISVFGWETQTLNPWALLTRTATETIARLGHEFHCETQERNGVTRHEDPSLAPWEELPHALRESNRLWADGIAAKLSTLRCVIAPAQLRVPEDAAFVFTDDEVESLSPLEHDRWSADMKRMGMSQGPIRDSTHHPLIDVPFEELPEDNKEKDRAHVRSIPHILSRAGFVIHRLDAANDVQPQPGAV